MTTTQRILFFFVLPMIAVLLYPPQVLLAGVIAIPIVIILFGIFGYFVWRGNSTALTFNIFLQGMNVIIRLMSLFSHAVTNAGQFDFLYVVFNLLGVCLSMYLLLRLDQVDIRSTMVT